MVKQDLNPDHLPPRPVLVLCTTPVRVARRVSIISNFCAFFQVVLKEPHSVNKLRPISHRKSQQKEKKKGKLLHFSMKG